MEEKDRPKWTNVAKLYEALCGGRDRPPRSLYIPGIGTHGIAERMLGPVTGYGIEKNIKEAYRHICSQYEPYRDHIYLLGFSRGAYTVRSLAGFVRHVGLLLKDKLDAEIETAFCCYWWGEAVGDYGPLQKFVYQITGKTEPGERERIFIYFIGVWDSVAAIGLPGFLGKPLKRWVKYHQVELPDHVTHAYQALALHELRDLFAPVFWSRKADGQTLEQVWFAGAHADVGGGYAQTALSDIALRWMQSKVRKADPDPNTGLDVAVGAGTSKTTPAPRDYQPQNTIVEEFEAFDPEVRALFRKEFDDDALGGVWDSIKLHASVKEHWRNEDAQDYRYGIAAVNQRLRQIDNRSLQFQLQQRDEYGIDFATD